MRKHTFLRIVELQSEQTEKHLAEVRGLHREMRAYKHDLHHHLQALRAIIELGDNERAIKYLDGLDAGLLGLDVMLKTGNVALDAILSGKISRAKELGAALNIRASVPDALTLTDVELCTVVGNLLDNALDACKKASGAPKIDIYIGMKGKMLYFYMLNTAGGKLERSGALFGTSKRGFHGFGLRRAQSVIAEHGGWCKFASEDGAFTSEFLVPALV